MILKSITSPLAMVLLDTLFISMSYGNEYLLADSFNKYVKFDIYSKHRNDCDDQNTGTNDAICADEDTTTTGGIDIE